MSETARVVVVGGGIWGCSIAYHLARAGVSDVLVLERRELASGNTSQAAGLVGQLRASELMARSIMTVVDRSEEHTSELQSHSDLVCRLLLEKKKKQQHNDKTI